MNNPSTDGPTWPESLEYMLKQSQAEVKRLTAELVDTRRGRSEGALRTIQRAVTAERERDAAVALLREALAAHDQARQIVKHYTDTERGGDYMVADAEWAKRARARLDAFLAGVGSDH